MNLVIDYHVEAFISEKEGLTEQQYELKDYIRPQWGFVATLAPLLVLVVHAEASNDGADKFD